jgi:NADH-quinone oxidoreductase subunit D
MPEMWINMGPQHPMTHGLWNLKVLVDGEVIVDAEPKVGYLHRGVEKISENRTYNQNIILADRLCYGSSLTWSHCYVRNVEELLGLEIPERAKYLRVIMLEIQRIASHQMWLAAFAADLGVLGVFVYCMRDREHLLDLHQMVMGARLNPNYMRIGGVRNDIPPNFKEKCRRVMKMTKDFIKAYEKGCDHSKIFQIRTYGLGKLSRSKAVNLGVTGPTLRGSNNDWDLRKTQPYEVYDELSDWQPIKEKGDDVFARHRVRMREMEESILMVEEALKKMPKGEVRVKAPRRIPPGDAMVSCEDPRGESMMYIVSDGTDKPYRWKIRSPIYINISAVPYMLRGYKVADVPSIMGSVDMCIGECDK